MKTREILELFRKGQVNEKTITECLVKINEKCEALESTVIELAGMINKQTDIIASQLRITSGQTNWIKQLQKKGILPEEVAVSSETLENKVHTPGLLK